MYTTCTLLCTINYFGILKWVSNLHPHHLIHLSKVHGDYAMLKEELERQKKKDLKNLLHTSPTVFVHRELVRKYLLFHFTQHIHWNHFSARKRNASVKNCLNVNVWYKKHHTAPPPPFDDHGWWCSLLCCDYYTIILLQCTMPFLTMHLYGRWTYRKVQ